jgi:tetratricopeptide (TPR) repeat protein
MTPLLRYPQSVMYKYASALVLLCLSLPAFSSDPNPHWLQVQSPHFIVLTDSNEKEARHIAGQMEQMRSVFHRLIPNATADSGSPITVVALRDKKGFQALEPAAYLAKGQLNLAGLFVRTPDKSYILLRLDADGEHPFDTVYHEYTHLMLSKAPWLPLWLNEGLAEFYQNTTIRDKEVYLGQPSENDILYLRQNRLLPLATLLKVDYSSPYYHEEEKGSVFYAESWALTHYIEVTDRQKNTTHLQDYVKLLAQQEDPVTAAQQVFGDLNQLQTSLNSYINQGDFKMFTFPAVLTVDPASFQARPVSQPEADAIRADVLINTGRPKEAQAFLESALRDDPNNALAHEAMGYLKFSENDIPAAKKWYGEAVQLDSQSYLAHYYFAVMSLQTGDHDHEAIIESSLQTAIKLNPSFAPSYDALATFYLSRNQKLDEAHILNVKAVQLEPANLSYRINTASVLSQQQKFSDAIGVLKAALPVAKSPFEIEMVQGRIDQLKKIQTAMTKADTQSPQTPQILTKTTLVQSADSSPDPNKTMIFRRVNGQVVGRMEDTPVYPAGVSKGPQHTIKGVIRSVACSYPTALALTLEQQGKKTVLYTNDYYKVVFTTANYEPEGDIKPCTGIEDMKASVRYAEVSDKNVAGQILAIELSK